MTVKTIVGELNPILRKDPNYLKNKHMIKYSGLILAPFQEKINAVLTCKKEMFLHQKI
jgi:hypothetical protein